MPALPVAPGCAQVAVQEGFQGVDMVNVFHFGHPDLSNAAWTQGEMDTLVSDVLDAYAAHFLTNQVTTVHLESVKGVDLSSNVGVVSEQTSTAVGSGGTQPLSSSVACCISWLQPVRFRGGHPRTYLGGLDVGSAIDVRHFTPAAVIALQEAAEEFRTSFTTAGKLVLLKRVVAGVQLTPPVMSPITGVRVNARLDSQRRRLGKT